MTEPITFDRTNRLYLSIISKYHTNIEPNSSSATFTLGIIHGIAYMLWAREHDGVEPQNKADIELLAHCITADLLEDIKRKVRQLAEDPTTPPDVKEFINIVDPIIDLADEITGAEHG